MKRGMTKLNTSIDKVNKILTNVNSFKVTVRRCVDMVSPKCCGSCFFVRPALNSSNRELLQKAADEFLLEDVVVKFKASEK